MLGSVYTGLHPMKSVGSCDREIPIQHVAVLNRSETGSFGHSASVFMLGFSPLFCICFTVLCSQFCLSFSGNFCDLMKNW